MSHMVFQAAQTFPSIIPIPKTLIHRRVLPIHTPAHWSPPSSSFKSYKALVLRALLAPAPVDGDVKVGLERCLRAPTAAGFDSPSTSSSAVTCGPGDKGKSGGGGGGAGGSATLERPKADSKKKKKKKEANFVPETDTGGGNDDGGKHLTHGGGDGGDDDSDDDDYFDDFDEGDEGHEGWVFRRRFVLAELFDRRFVDAVLSEWQRTLTDLPAGMIEAYKEGLVSSAQMVKFLAINARPTTTRFISRALPEAIYGEFIGRMIADPAFLYRLFLEQTATIGCCVWSELNNRKERIKQEWDLALLNVLTVTACNAIVVWSLAPCRSYSTGQMLPNNVFERSYPRREFDLAKRIISFFHKASHLCMVGFTAGAAQGAMSNFCASKKEGRLSVSIPTVSSNALGYGVFLGFYANFRYQLLCGIDHAMINYFDAKTQVPDSLIPSLFATISSFEASYLHLQTAHVPYHEDTIKAADRTLVSHLQRLSDLRQWYRNYLTAPHTNLDFPIGSCSEAQVQENQSKLRCLETVFNRLQAEIDEKGDRVVSLKQELDKMHKSNAKLSKKLVVHSSFKSKEIVLTVRVFDSMLREACRSMHGFTKLLIELMKKSNWDLDLAANSVHSGIDYAKKGHNRYAFLSYVSLCMFRGFDLEGFGMLDLNGILCNGNSSNSVEKNTPLGKLTEHLMCHPMEVLSKNPNCGFSRFCESKYQQLIHPTMESSIFSNLDQNEVVLNSWKSLSVFYESFVKMASSIWLLHKLAFSFDPVVEIFQVERGVEFSMVYMEDVTKKASLSRNSRPKVGFTVIPGFKIGRTVLQSQVYLVGLKCTE